MSSNIIAIVGRPNVGKSTLFNRLIGERVAIVHDFPGVTRDRKYAEAEWAGKRFTIIDTGGFIPKAENAIERAIREQAEIAIQEADSVLFLVDAKDGVLELDRDIANILRKTEKKVHLVVNKIDSAKQELHKNEFFELGLGEPFSISALGGRQIGDFLDVITSSFPKNGTEGEDERLRVAIIGKPNVGKSSLVNALLGKNRNVVTDIPGTTRDPIDSMLKYQGEEIILVDTAGLKKRKQMLESLEFYSALRTLKSIERSDVAVILFDAQRGIDKQDQHIVETALERRRASIIAVNKWDMIEKETNTALHIEQVIRKQLGMYDFLPIVFISALTKQRIAKVIDLARQVHTDQIKRIETSDLNDALLPDIERNPPKSSSPKEIKIKYITQLKTKPPLFAFFCNHPKLVQESYKRFLENRLREHFGFQGVPLSLIFKQK
ncbi:MAG: ribosome biogenesis GTPase Der [Ignavibacteriae bacterium]|nr:ribosome biogenesis GTPase Der [Ignavibacteriota bacterium]